MKQIKTCMAILALGLMSTTNYAQSWSRIGLGIMGEAPGDWSGSSVALSGDGTTVAIGATQNNANGSASSNNGLGSLTGHVRVYRRIAGVWRQQGSDIDGEAAGDLSGESVSLSDDGRIVAIGSPYNRGITGRASGHVRVYKFINGTWVKQGADIDAEPAGDWNTSAVSLSADGMTVATGSPFNNGNGIQAGHVRVYRFVNGAWVKRGADIDGEAAGDRSGWSVSLSSDGNTVAIGASFNNGRGNNSGHVRVYKFINGVWRKQGSDIDGEAAGDFSGESVSLSADGTIVAIGAYGNTGTISPSSNGGYSSGMGHVRVYRLISGVWRQQGADIDGEAADDTSGWAVSLSSDGRVVAIGARNNSGNGTKSGHVRIYRFINGAWLKQGQDIDGDTSFDECGASVSLSADGRTVAIGAPFWGNNYRGLTRVFTWNDAPKEREEKVGASSPTLETTGSILEAKIYPNPVRETATLQYTLVEATTIEVSVYDLFGRLVGTPLTANEQSAGEYTVTLPVEELGAGLYNVVMTTPKGRVSQKLVVVK